MDNKFFFLFLIILLPGHCFGQNQTFVDSLVFLLETPPDRTEDHFELLRNISHNHPDTKKALSFSEQAYALALNVERPDLQAKALEEIGVNQRLLGNNTEAVNATLRALRLFEELGDQEAQAATLVQLGSNGVVDETYREALTYFQRALSIYSGLSNSVAKFNEALTWINQGEAYRLAGLLDSAKYGFRQGLVLRDSLQRSIDKDIITAYATGNLGMVYNTLDSLAIARRYLAGAISMTLELGDPYTSAVYLADLGLLEQKEKHHVQAETYMLEAYQMALTEGLKEQVRDISSLLVSYYEDQQDFEVALFYQKVYQQYQDSLVNKKNVQKVEQLKASYEIDKRDSEIDLLSTINRQQKLLMVVLGIGLILILLFTFLIYRTNGQLKQSNTALVYQKNIVSKREEEKAWLLHELNHRVKNNLQMISSLFSLQESQLKGHPAEAAISAGKYRVNALSLIHRKLYQKDHHTEVLLEEYLPELVQNLFHGFGVRWKPRLELQPISLHIDVAIPLALIVNELISNSLKYAYEETKDPDLFLGAWLQDNRAILNIRDNGVGYEETIDHDKGFGRRLVQQLVGQIGGKLDRLQGPGTSWQLEFDIHNPANQYP